jgi:hypothetical protein
MHITVHIKIKYITLLFPVMLTANLFAQKTDLQRDNLQGKVRAVKFFTDSKLVKTRTYNTNGFETSLKKYCPGSTSIPCLHDSSMYDQNGNMVKYMDDNHVIEKKYDGANNLVESIGSNRSNTKIFDKLTYSYVGIHKVRSEQTKYLFNSDIPEFNIVIGYSYDAGGNLVKEDNAYTSAKGTIKKTTVYQYDNAKKLIAKTESNSDGVMQYSFRYQYDSANRKTEYQARSFNESSYTNYNEYFKYDSKGHVIESSHFELSGKLLYRDLYDFDDMGNQIKRSHYFGDVLTTQTVDVFDTRGMLVTELEYRSGTLALKKAFTYDVAGNVITALYTDANGTLKTRLDYIISYY